MFPPHDHNVPFAPPNFHSFPPPPPPQLRYTQFSFHFFFLTRLNWRIKLSITVGKNLLLILLFIYCNDLQRKTTIKLLVNCFDCW
ncbi:unnamed protein product [Meloidogyne enterolobii]|uniref:Uncharacterized protein n=1 Tax=Meloidogyne enterolobii TaxID=390850 RepID=A0ACB0XLP7_MELEN